MKNRYVTVQTETGLEIYGPLLMDDSGVAKVRENGERQRAERPNLGPEHGLVLEESELEQYKGRAKVLPAFTPPRK